MKKTIFVLSFCCLFYACTQENKEVQEENVQQILPETSAEVTVDTLKTRVFSSEIVSNGQLESSNIAELRFQLAEPIKKVYVHNGEFVKKGQILAELESFTYQNSLLQAEDNIESTQLELQDILIGQGYKLRDSTTVPDEIMELASIKSGYYKALNKYKQASHEKNKTTLIAPISGVIANIKGAQNKIANPSEPFCSIVDLHSMKVSFSILENELAVIKLGDKVKIKPYAFPDLEMNGIISEINPWVNKDGMVDIKASVNYNPKMVEGMNVKVSIFRTLENQWVVPKAAVVLRTGKPVVFSYKDGKALWNYVTKGLENASEYTIESETLKEGDIIITTGNVNLAHESPVEIITSN